MGQEYQYLFNEENIDRVIVRGYEDEEREAFMKKLNDYTRNH